MSLTVFLFAQNLLQDVAASNFYSEFIKQGFRFNRHCCKSHNGNQTRTGCENVDENSALISILVISFLLFLVFLGLIKACIGLWCSPKIGISGLNFLIDLPRPLQQYQEKELQCYPVVYDIGGWPVHPCTCERTVRVLPKRTEFCINVIFFLAYPLAACVYLCALCCCIQNCKSNDCVCYKHVDVVRVTSGENVDCKEGQPINAYKEDVQEAHDTRYVLNAIMRSLDSIEKFED